MEKIDFSPIEPFMDDLFNNVLLVLGVPLVVALLAGFLLRLIRVPRLSTGTIACIVFLFLVYQMFTKVIV
ncbi:hypothetical protein [Cytobacillus firmus]|uniref:hypothetical protein n=1 Tax=Cytobacillus firmus TaxID=1399 RepID=UPI0018CCF062|nr:hypothetical protein [Cytobacillus firmus]MBG9587396.1 hypothetical protein [Cytobacillus firmus]